LTLAQACDHSPGQLRLLVRAADRIKADQGLLDLNVTYAGTVAAMVKEGGGVMKDLQKQLKKRATGIP